MLKASEDITNKVSVVRRLVFASAVLPPDCPHYWNIVSSFASSSEEKTIVSSTKAKTFVQNLQFVEPDLFVFDHQLAVELQSFTSHLGKSLGLVLISNNNKCVLCGCGLLVKADRVGRVTIYTDEFGTIEGSHYRKICKKFRSGCPFVQHYGYYSKGTEEIVYNDDYKSLHYFVSTRETAFEMSLLDQFDIEVLIGQLSYKQRSEIYNMKHGYDKAKKKVHSGTMMHKSP